MSLTCLLISSYRSSIHIGESLQRWGRIIGLCPSLCWPRSPKIIKMTPAGETEKKPSTSFTTEELPLVANAFMQASSNAKHGTPKKGIHFGKIFVSYKELVLTTTKISESNLEFLRIGNSCNAESLHNCSLQSFSHQFKHFVLRERTSFQDSQCIDGSQFLSASCHSCHWIQYEFCCTFFKEDYSHRMRNL